MQLDSNQIQEILPHRYPFLLVDRITECIPGEKAVGVKCVSTNEMQFLGHFQTGAVAVLTEEENRGKIVLFAGVKAARFKKQVVPGDVLELSCELIMRKGPIGVGRAVARVDGKIAVTAELTFAIESN